MSNLYVYLLRSRNKDNKDVANYKERTKVILERRENEDKVREIFSRFVSEGVYGEKSRLYRSVNSRNEEKIRESLLIRLIKDKPDITKLNSTLASIAQNAECRDESQWIFDFDCKDEEALDEFIMDIPSDTITYETPNGFAVVALHGFDTRELLEKWADYDVTLKRDDMLFLDMVQRGF